MAMLVTILGFALFIFAIRTVNRWNGGRIPIQVHVMIGIVGVVVLLMGLYLLTAPQVPKSIPSDISLRAGDPGRDRRSLRAGHYEPDRAQQLVVSAYLRGTNPQAPADVQFTHQQGRGDATTTATQLASHCLLVLHCEHPVDGRWCASTEVQWVVNNRLERSDPSHIWHLCRGLGDTSS
jgi:hypothetical protein